MSTTLSKGYKLPDTGDRGSSFFPDLESNITLVNAHKHDGVDGEKVTASDLIKKTNTVLAANWGADLGGGTYTQNITMPAGATFDAAILKVQETGVTGSVLYPTIVRIGASSYSISVSDNTLELLVTYG